MEVILQRHSVHKNGLPRKYKIYKYKTMKDINYCTNTSTQLNSTEINFSANLPSKTSNPIKYNNISYLILDSRVIIYVTIN